MTSTVRSCHPNGIVKLALLGLGLLLLQPALARQDDREKPANIQAKSFDATQQGNGVITYKDNVLLTQGTLKATGSLAKAYLDENNSITRVVLTGSPARIEELDDKGNLMQGNAASIDYDNVKQIAVLSGNAKVTQKGRGEADGDKLTYNTQTSQMTGESNGDGMVHMTFLPKPHAAAAARPASPAPATATPATTTPAHTGSTPPGQP